MLTQSSPGFLTQPPEVNLSSYVPKEWSTSDKVVREVRKLQGGNLSIVDHVAHEINSSQMTDKFHDEWY